MDEVSMLIADIEKENIIFLLIFYVFLLLAALTIMNMLVGVITEMVLKVGAAERQQATKSFVTDKLMELVMTGTDENDDDFISKDEFIRMLHNKRATCILHEVGVDVVGLVDLVDTIFEPIPGTEHLGERQLTLPEFMKAILELRGDQGAKVRDIKDVKKYINECFFRLEQKILHLESVKCLNTSLQNKNAPYMEAEQATPPDEPVAQRPNAIWGGQQRFKLMQFHGSSQTMDSQEVEPMSVNSLQEQIDASLRKVQKTHERELASLHAENLRLLDRLTELEALAGNSSSEAELKVTASATTPPTEILTSEPPFPVVELPHVQSIHAGMDGLPAVPKEAKRPVPRHSPNTAAADPHTGSRESAKQRGGSHRMSMLMQQARRSLVGNA